MNAGASYASGIGVHSMSSAAYSIKVNGSPRANNYASQAVTVNQPGTQAYVLSGWAKANSVPDNKMGGDPKKDNEAAAKDKNKQFGLRAVLTYANNGGTEYYYAPFNPDLPGWQFTSLTIVPKQSAAYTSNNNLAASVTDTANQKESYVYGTKQSVMTGQATAVSDAMGNTTTTTYDSKGRVTKKDFANKGSLVYTYTEGILY